LIGVAVGGFAFLVGCTVAVTIGSGKAKVDSHDTDDHAAHGTNVRSFDTTISTK